MVGQQHGPDHNPNSSPQGKSRAILKFFQKQFCFKTGSIPGNYPTRQNLRFMEDFPYLIDPSPTGDPQLWQM